MTRVAPRNGMIVIDPATRQPLREIGIDGFPGEDRDLTDPYWHRRHADADIQIVDAVPPPAAPVEAATEQPASKSKRKKSTDEGK